MADHGAVEIVALEAAHRADCLVVVKSLPEWFSYPGALDDIGASLDRDQGFVAMSDGAVKAFITLSPLFDETVEIKYLAVHKSARRSGLGRSLVKAARGFADRRGAHNLSLLTLGPSGGSPFYDETVRFYVALGFARAKELHISEWGGAPALVLCASTAAIA